jgi:hypothetical protein
MKNLFRTTLLLSLLLSSALLFAQDLIVVSDLEGKMDSLMSRISRNGNPGLVLVTGPDGKPRLDFRPGRTDRFVFGGDLMDGGGDSLELLRMFNDFKDRHPNRVTLLIGNRDGDDLFFHQQARTLPANPAYQRFLASKDLADNELARVRWFFEDYQGIRAGFDNYKLSLENQLGRPVTPAEAAAHYVRNVSPGGDLFRYLERAELVFHDPTRGIVSVHAGVTDGNIGYVPGRSTSIIDETRVSISDWGRQLDWPGKMRELRIAIESGSPIPESALNYVNSNYSFGQNGAGGNQANDSAVIYAERVKDGDQIRLGNRASAQRMVDEGVRLAFYHHTPVGDAPLPLRDPLGMLVIYGDTTFGAHNATATSHIDESGRYHFRGTVGSDPRFDISYGIRHDDPPGSPSWRVGQMTDDGHTIIGLTASGDEIGFKYDGYNKVYTNLGRQVVAVKPPVIDVNSEVVRDRAALRQNLDKRGFTIREIPDQTPMTSSVMNLPADRRGIVFMGGANYSDAQSPELIRRELRATLQGLNPDEVYFVHGGSAKGADRILYDLLSTEFPQFQQYVVAADLAKIADLEHLDPTKLAGLYMAPGGWGDFTNVHMKEFATRGDPLVINITGGGGARNFMTSIVEAGGEAYVMTGVGGASDAIAESVRTGVLSAGPGFNTVPVQTEGGLLASIARNNPQLLRGQSPTTVRILRGRPGSDDFTRMSPDPNRRIVMTTDDPRLVSLASSGAVTPEALRAEMVRIGWPEADIDRYVAEGLEFRLAVVPPGDTALPATWGNYLNMLAEVNPSLPGAYLQSFESQLAQNSGPEGYRNLMQSRPADFRGPMTERMLADAYAAQGSKLEPWQVRQFLHDQYNLNELYRGDGYTYTAAGERGVREYITANRGIDEMNARLVNLPSPSQVPRLPAAVPGGPNCFNLKTMLGTILQQFRAAN